MFAAGTLPSCLGDLQMLEKLRLATNSLTGLFGFIGCYELHRGAGTNSFFRRKISSRSSKRGALKGMLVGMRSLVPL